MNTSRQNIPSSCKLAASTPAKAQVTFQIRQIPAASSVGSSGDLISLGSFRNELQSGLACSSADARKLHANPLRSEEHTSELQSRGHLVCRLLLEKKKQQTR